MKFELQNVTIDDVVCFPAYIAAGKEWNGFALPYFTLEQGKRLCDHLNTIEYDRWEVINLTDGIIAIPITSKRQALHYINEFPERFKSQGFYLTANGEKIKPEEVKLEIRPVGSNVEKPKAKYVEASDTFIIPELVEDDEWELVEYPGEDIKVDGGIIRTYPIGAGAWIWSVTT